MEDEGTLKLKIVLSILVIFCLLAVTGYLFYRAVGHTDETSWGSWYQEYQIAYTDGTTAPLSLYHNSKSVSSVEYLLKATVNSGSKTIDYSNYRLNVKVNNVIVDFKEFTGSKTISYQDGETQLLYASLPLTGLRGLSNGTYAVSFVPSGSILVDDISADLPSSASVMVRVGSIPSNDDPPDEDPPDDDEKEINFESDVVWS